MHPHLQALPPYPFERYRQLVADLTPADLPLIDLGIGEPRGAAPAFVLAALADPDALAQSIGSYPATRGSATLRAAMANWLDRRFQLGGQVDPEQHVLPVGGTREGLFSTIQALVGQQDGLVLLPNPFYQIYEGATVLAGCQPWYMPDRGGLPDLDAIPAQIWEQCRLLVICSPHNPTGAVADAIWWQTLLALSERYGFTVLSDECYSELYPDEAAPPQGLLGAAAAAGNTTFARCLVVQSLSKRSNLPGLRSGLMAGDARLIAPLLTYRTYHGVALPAHIQAASALAWADETHVVANRAALRQRTSAVLSALDGCLDVAAPAGGFYLWPQLGGSDEAWARALFRHCHIRALPGSFLARPDSLAGANPGAGHLRLALVHDTATCTTAAQRLRQYLADHPNPGTDPI